MHHGAAADQLFLALSRHYKQAYTHLVELRVVDSNLLEVKTLGGFINYKACHFLYINTYLLSCHSGWS